MHSFFPQQCTRISHIIFSHGGSTLINRSEVLRKFSVYMPLSLGLMIFTAYITAEYGFDVLAEIFGGSALGVWLVIIAAGGISAFLIRKKIWSMDFAHVICLLVLYAIITGIMFSVFFLGASSIGVTIASVIFILAALHYSQRALSSKNTSRAAVCWALSVYLGVLMAISLWVLIWGAWDTTNRRYSRNRKGRK